MGKLLYMRFTIKSVKGNKGSRTWNLEYRVNGKRERQRFKTKELALAEQERIEAQVSDGGTAWLALKDSQRIELMAVLREITESGLTLRGVWEEHKRRSTGKKLIEKTFREAYEQYYSEQTHLKLSKRTLAKIKSNVGRFIQPRAAMYVHQATRKECMDYLQPYKGETFNTYRTSVNTFFTWCVALKYAEENPLNTIQPIDLKRLDKDKPPGVLHYDECIALFKASLKDPGMIRFTATCIQAGLRPEREAPLLHPSDITDKIHVRGKTAKDRQARYVPIVPALKEWLALPMPEPFHGPQVGDWPITNLRKRFDRIRADAGLITLKPRTRPKKRGKGESLIGYTIVETKWAQDCMRHTFASAYYAVYGAEATIEALGHGDYESLFGHYRRLMTKEEGQKILSITPATVSS